MIRILPASSADALTLIGRRVTRDPALQRQVLELAVSQAGLSWNEDIAPWLGERVAFGLIDLGGLDAVGENAVDTMGAYRTPAFVLALQTRDKAASDKALANVRSLIEKDIKPNGYFTTTIGDDTYRGMPLVYMTNETARSSGAQENLAYATVNDVIVVTPNRATLQKVIDVAFDGKSLVTSQNYQTVLNTLPDQNAGTLYMDYAQFMPAYLAMMTGMQSSMDSIYGNIYDELECSSGQGTPDPQCAQENRDEAQRKRDEAPRQQEEQIQQMQQVTLPAAATGPGLPASEESPTPVFAEDESPSIETAPAAATARRAPAEKTGDAPSWLAALAGLLIGAGASFFLLRDRLIEVLRGKRAQGTTAPAATAATPVSRNAAQTPLPIRPAREPSMVVVEKSSFDTTEFRAAKGWAGARTVADARLEEAANEREPAPEPTVIASMADDYDLSGRITLRYHGPIQGNPMNREWVSLRAE